MIRKLLRWINWARVRLRYRRAWVGVGDNLRRRKYKDTNDYKAHQRSKFQFLNLSERNRTLRANIPLRVIDLPIWENGRTVLCLGARSGGEVQAFLDLGCFAVGIDLNPGRENPYVLYGDFHAIQFPDGSADIVYTNSIDHAFDMAKVIGEIKRVLKPSGHLILEIPRGRAEGKEPQFWESIWWEKLDDVLGLFVAEGFTLIQQRPYAAQKEQVCFRRG